ncbi:MAG TPA: serine hydrolase domain-containing protein, partial [Myxococcota bacterium]|nr:serine hydrolase domain-containing protein [Myxococcota bacterium]
MAGAASPARVGGECAKRFARVREVFEQSFASGEVGASVAVTVGGELVLDLWGGHRDGARTKPWLRDTLANVYSTTKGMTAICANRLAQAGKLDLDAPVARYWPEFAQAGKGSIPVRWLLCHKAGLAAIRKPLPAGAFGDWKLMTESLAAESPWWEPGTAHGYHALSYGFLVGEVLRRIDGRTLGAHFRDELALPLGLDFHIGFG